MGEVRKGPAVSEEDALLTPQEVSRLLMVDPRTVVRLADAGKLSPIRTPGNHRRYRETEVRALLAERGGRNRVAL
jgi:excisionase family DNA binding protein